MDSARLQLPLTLPGCKVLRKSPPSGDFCRYVMLAKPGGVESVFQTLKANAEELSDMGKVVEIVTAQGVQIAA